jgi:hypothetical protein
MPTVVPLRYRTFTSSCLSIITVFRGQICVRAFDGLDLWFNFFSHANHLRWRICLYIRG